ncbi:MAG: cob(I)yrinic acid a,c-diamide adenosyltransferase [Candidatus Dactylopiibacterium sp.]|nr:cob(I)yrinic acid a,c-diamide adenosyltransferase [Candidatus Dactylopiibacterium sp.]
MSENTPEQEREIRHKARMARKKAVIDAQIAAASESRGLLLINTGTGKGKSSAAFGVLARALGHGMQCAVIQFIKSRSDTGEEAFFRQHDGVRWHVMGEGFTWDTQDDARDRATARLAWEQALTYLADPAVDLLILDEFSYALKFGWVTLEEVIHALDGRPRMQHVIVTGRAAPAGLIEIADTVSEMRLEKHAFHAGVQAMPGIEW